MSENDRKKKKKQKRKLEITWGQRGGGRRRASESARIDARQNCWILLVNVANKMQGQLINHYLSRAIAKNSCIVHRCAWLLRICVSISRYYAALFCAFLLKKKKERKKEREKKNYPDRSATRNPRPIYTYERGESKEISFSI